MHSNEAVEKRTPSDYSIIRLGRRGPRWFRQLTAGYQPIYTGEPVEEKLGSSTLEIMGIEYRMVEVTLKEGPSVKWHIPGQPGTDITLDMEGELTIEAPTVSRIRRFEVTFSTGEGKSEHTLTLQGNLFRNWVKTS